MSLTTRRSLQLSLVTMLAAACPKTEEAPIDAGPKVVQAPVDELKPVTETESNDTPQTAQKIFESARVSGSISAVQPATRPDEDWYLIQPSQAPQDLSVALLPEIGGQVTVEAYDRDRNKLMARTFAGEAPDGGPPVRTLVFPQLRVRDQLYVRIAAGKASGKYTLELKLSAPDPDREAEPNNKPLDATSLPLDHPMHGTYGTEGDQDFYVVELEASAPATSAAPAPVPDGSAPPSPEAAAPPAPPPASPAASPTASPTASPNDAGLLPGALANDPNAPPIGLLRVSVTGVAGIRHAITFYDQNQVPFASMQAREVGGPLEVRDLPIKPGMTRVTLMLESAFQKKKRPFSDEPYTVTVKREAAPPDVELEPNDTTETATPLVIRTVVSPDQLPGSVQNATAHRTGWLSPQGDVDVYKLHLDSPMRVHAVLSALDRVDTELLVLDPGPRTGTTTAVLTVNEGGPKEPEVIPAVTLGAGDHYFQVLAASHKVGDKWVRDQEDPDQSYSLDLALSPDDGAFEREPNNTPATATAFTAGKPLSGYLFPAKDVDVYRLDLSAQPVAAAATIKATGVTRVPISLEIREAKGTELGDLLNSADPGKPGLDAVIHQKLEPGVYFLTVRAHPQAKATATPLSDPEMAYKLSVDLE